MNHSPDISSSHRKSAGLRVLHVDDDPDFLMLFSLLFKDSLIIDSQEDPCRIPWDNLDSYDAVITDYDMPECNGLELLKKIKASQPQLPVIMFTGQGNEDVARKAFINGASDYFTKDFTGFAYRERLINSLANAVQIHQARQIILENEKKLQTLFEEAEYPIMVVDDQANYLNANKSALNFLEVDLETLRTKKVWDFDLPGTVPRTRQEHSPFTTQRTLRTDYLVGGKVKTLMLNVIPVKTSRGYEIFGIGQEITDTPNTGNIIEAEKPNAPKTGHLSYSCTESLGTWEWNPETGQTYMDPGLKGMLGYQDHEISNNPECWLNQIHPQDRAGVEILLDETINSNETNCKSVHRMIHRNGSILWIQSVATVFRDSSGKALRMVGTDTDITLHKTMEEELVSRNRELMDFAYRVSHDLKSPLNVIRGFISVIEEEPDLFQEYFSRIKESADQMADFIDRLLQLSRAGRVIEQFQPIQLEVLACQAFKTENTEGIPAVFKADEPLLPVTGDPDALEQLFINLVGNCFRHRDPQKKKLEIQLSVTDEGPHRKIVLQDNGLGIKQENLTKIFRTGFTGDRSRGTGFGLAIARKIVSAHNGTIKAESPGPGHGSRFVILLPRDPKESGAVVKDHD